MGVIKAGKYRFNDELEGLSSFTVAIPFYTDTTPEFVLDDAGTPTELTVANNPLHFNTINWDEVIYASGRWFRLQYIPNETFAAVYEQANVYRTEPATLWECFYDVAVEFLSGVGLDVPVSEMLKGFGQTITITEDTEVDDTFAQWFAANTTSGETSASTIITYNGTDTELNEGQIATLHCANKKAVSDIVVAFGSAGTITYNGTETSVESGKTATLQCNGKKMKSDVVIAL